jgi:hypothetical protein
MTPVLYVVKPPVETVSSRHHRLSIDSQKSEYRDITDKLSLNAASYNQYREWNRKYFTFTQVKSSAAYVWVVKFPNSCPKNLGAAYIRANTVPVWKIFFSNDGN